MRTLLLSLVLLSFSSAGNAQYVTIPDPVFKTYLQQLYPECFNGSGQMDTTCTSILNEISMPVPGYQFDGLQSLEGIQYFKKIQSLNFNNTNLSYIPTFCNSLMYISISNNKLTALPSLPSGIWTLDCSGNQLSVLPVMPDELNTLKCSKNLLTDLPILPNNLIELDCSYNNFSNLTLLPVNFLTSLKCGHNNLTNLNLSGMQNLHDLDCSNNQLTSLQWSDNLREINCSYNQLTHLPPYPKNLFFLDCSHNLLSSLPAFTNNYPINKLDCHANKIFCFPIVKAGNIYDIYIDDVIKCVNISGKPEEVLGTGSISTYDFTGKFSGMYVYSKYTPEYNFPICNPTNNLNGCTLPLLIKGKVYYDNNNNNVQDNNEPAASNISIKLNSNQTVNSVATGAYQFAIDVKGNYKLWIVPPPYFAITPDTALFTFNTNDTLVTQDFPLHATEIKDSLHVSITPLRWGARPGFSFSYLINYNNAGTTNLTPTISVQYDSKLLVDSSNNPNLIHFPGVRTLQLLPGTLAPGSKGSFIVYFTIDPLAAIGDTIISYTTISNGVISQTDSSKVLITGSFDPNDKQSTLSLTPTQVINGSFIDYTIRFQNTGNDTAFNIVIADTLSNLLQAESFEMINSSHNCKATRINNILYFEFLNVNLVDSITNEPSSHGFVSFRIKPLKTVAINNVIENKSYIYFDYNAPVVTNIATTIIQVNSTTPVHLINFAAHATANNQLLLNWLIENELNSKNYEVEKSTDGIRFSGIGTINAQGLTSYNFTTAMPIELITYYRLKINDIDGKSTYSYIVKVQQQKTTIGLMVMNPVRNNLTINVTDENLINTNAVLLNVNGQSIKKISLKQGLQNVNIGNLTKGTYYLQTKQGNVRVVVL